jgi:hypothetical protein
MNSKMHGLLFSNVNSVLFEDVGEGKNVSSVTETRSKKPRITSSPVAKLKSPPAVSRR